MKENHPACTYGTRCVTFLCAELSIVWIGICRLLRHIKGKELRVNSGMNTVIYPVKDLEKAKAIFSALLGVGPTTDSPYYVGYSVAGQEFGLNPNGHSSGMSGATPFWPVDDIRESLRQLIEAGATAVQDATDVGGGRLVASVKDADGNMIGLMQG